MRRSVGLTVFWWKTAMMTSSNENIFRVTGLLCGEFSGHQWIPCTGASDAELMFSLICVWINSWVNNREAGDLKRHRAQYDVIVMLCYLLDDTVFRMMSFMHIIQSGAVKTWSIFVTNPHNRYSIARLWGRYMGCFCERTFWFMFCLCYYSADIYNNMLYWTAS